MSTNSTTTIIFVPGAWHSPDAFENVGNQLSVAGYKVQYVPLASVGAKEPLKDFLEDVSRIRDAIKAEADQDQNVVLVVHSYGGLPGNEAIKDLDAASRRKDGKRGGVSHLFFCCSFVIPEGQSLYSAFGSQDLPWWNISDDKMTVTTKTPAETFYNDVDEDVVKKMVDSLQPHSYQTFHSKVTYAAWKHVPSTYLYCLKDEAIPMEIQKMMVEKTAKGTKMNTEELDASHSPFLSMPQKMAESIRRAAGETL